jgi:hypothetical protein
MTKSKTIELTTEEIRTIWDYRDGELWWKERGKGRILDRPAGAFTSHGYRRINVNGIECRVHRLIWLWHGRELVDGLVIDHIDNNPSNNHIENLQQITTKENNCRRECIKNSKGTVYFSKQAKKWHVQLRRNNKRINLGYFGTREEAVECLENYRNEQARSDSSTSDGARGETSEALCVN